MLTRHLYAKRASLTCSFSSRALALATCSPVEASRLFSSLRVNTLPKAATCSHRHMYRYNQRKRGDLGGSGGDRR